MSMHCAIIAAGEGSRLAQEGILRPKPLVELDGRPMIVRLIDIMASAGADSITVAVRDTMPDVIQVLESVQGTLPCPLRILPCNTPSSMHSFHVVSQAVEPGPLVLTTVDTIFRADDFRAYAAAFAAEAKVDKNTTPAKTDKDISQASGGTVDALMGVTDFIDDEKPLYVDVDANGRITAFRDSASAADKYISGGIYGLSQSARDILNDCIASGTQRMRNYQRALLSAGLNVKAFPFSKIIDVDHAADIDTARSFINDSQAL